jgi:CRISPR system Cascade subunit CasA
VSTISFNLWSEPWIRVVHIDGTLTELSISDCLYSAPELGALADPSPLVVCGTHRLLVAILQYIFDPESLSDLTRLLRTGKVDAGKVDKFAAQFIHRFDLFHPTEPFLQTGDIALTDSQLGSDKNSSISRLFTEIPTATNRTLFRHVTDGSHRVCPVCCAGALITVPAFASSGGSGIYPSINGVPPVYILPMGKTLFETLAFSLMSQDAQPRMAASERAGAALWNADPIIGHGTEVFSVGYIESLLFPARRLRLFPELGALCCTQCGRETSVSVREIFFEMGHRLDTKNRGSWDDPFVAFQPPQKDGEYPRSIQPKEGKALWREFTGLFLAKGEKGERPKVISQLYSLADRGLIDDSQLMHTRCLWLRTDGKAKMLEWGDDSLESPVSLLILENNRHDVDTALERAESVQRTLRKLFGKYSILTQNKGASGEHFRSIRSRMEAAYWQQLASPFRTYLNDLAATFASGDNTRLETVNDDWIVTLFAVGRRVFREATDQFGDRAEAIRARVEAQAGLDSLFFNKLAKEWKTT